MREDEELVVGHTTFQRGAPAPSQLSDPPYALALVGFSLDLEVGLTFYV